MSLKRLPIRRVEPIAWEEGEQQAKVSLPQNASVEAAREAARKLRDFRWSDRQAQALQSVEDTDASQKKWKKMLAKVVAEEGLECDIQPRPGGHLEVTIWYASNPNDKRFVIASASPSDRRAALPRFRSDVRKEARNLEEGTETGLVDPPAMQQQEMAGDVCPACQGNPDPESGKPLGCEQCHYVGRLF